MGGKSSGGYDAGPMIEYGNKALKLQERMYDDSIDRTGPYYDVGTGGLGMLADLLGIEGGSVRSRDNMMQSMKDQYTTNQTTNNPDSGMYVTPDGLTVDLANADQYYDRYNNRFNLDTDKGAFGIARKQYDSGNLDYLTDMGWKALNPNTTKSVTDYDALNAAVDASMANQETPDNYGSLLESFDMDKFQADPGYQFRLEQGNKAIERAAAARGQYYDPSTVKALSDYNSGMADQTYGDAYNRYNNDQNTIFNRLAAISGIGQTANNSLNQVGQNYANQAGNIYGQMGSAQMEANAANAAAPSMFDSLLGAGVQLGSAYLMSDIRTKENIEYIGDKNGIAIIEFNYIGDNTRYRGVSAQDVEIVKPEAVKEINGIKHVNYSMIGIDMQEVA